MRPFLILLLAGLALACHTTPDAGTTAEFSSMTRSRSSAPASGAAVAVAAVPFDAVQEMIVTGSGAGVAPDTLAPGDALPDPARREVVYTADLELVVVSIEQASRAVQTLSEQMGGHLQESDSSSITVRVPAAHFETTLERIATLGEVVDRSISAADVTEEVLDLGIRLDNARRARERLLEHLARSQKIGDTLKIEKELTRVSETIEQIEGKLRHLRSQIALSTITVGWTARAENGAGAGASLGLPFAWIEELGDGLVAGQVAPMTREAGLFERVPRFAPPTGFIRYFESRTLVEALSADGLRIKVRRHANHDRGPLAFWSGLARESLVRTRGVAIAEERDLGGDRTLIRGTREVAGETLGYLLVLTRTNRRVYSLEAWGPKATFDERASELESSARSLGR